MKALVTTNQLNIKAPGLKISLVTDKVSGIS